MGVSYDGDDVKVKGADDTIIGQVGDRLKVDSQITGVLQTTNGINCAVENPRIIASETSITIVNQNSPHTVIYSYTGSGKLFGFTLEYTNYNINCKVVVDGSELFDIDCSILRNMFSGGTEKNIMSWITYDRSFDLFHFKPRDPFIYASSISIECRANNNNSGREVTSNFVELTKES